MSRIYRLIDLDREGDVVIAHLRPRRMDEIAIHHLGNELIDLIEQEGCRKLALSLGKETLDCLYSVFLAKMVMVQRRLQENRGALVLCDVTPEVQSVFEACKLGNYFEFVPDRASALDSLAHKNLA